MSCHVMPRYVRSCYVIQCHVMLCHVMSSHVVMSCYVMLCTCLMYIYSMFVFFLYNIRLRCCFQGHWEETVTLSMVCVTGTTRRRLICTGISGKVPPSAKALVPKQMRTIIRTVSLFPRIPAPRFIAFRVCRVSLDSKDFKDFKYLLRH